MSEQDTTEHQADPEDQAEATEGTPAASGTPGTSSADAPEGTEQESAAEAQDDRAEDQQDDDDGKVRKVRKEAATYRQRARDAEAERDTLKGRVEALEWREVQRHIPKGAPKLEALQKLGLELNEVRDDQGDIDPQKVTAAVEAAAELVGVSLTSGPRMPLEGKAPASHGIPRSVQDALSKALSGS